MYSQNDEERVIVDHFRVFAGARRFLDIGAHDGVHLSNTRRLAELGWGGTLVEPSPGPFVQLMANYRGREDVKLAHVAVVPSESSILEFYDSGGDFVSTFDEKHRALWSATGADGRQGVPYQKILVSGVTVRELLRVCPGPYDFVNIDVEGINFEIFRELSMVDLSCGLLCIEYQDKLKQIIQLAAPHGFNPIHTTSENVILVRK